jgi:hypothetical protein
MVRNAGIVVEDPLDLIPAGDFRRQFEVMRPLSSQGVTP